MRHDCVVVPGLGSFVTNDEPACYDCARQAFLPPRRSIGFNPEVRHNDAMLIGSVSRVRGVSVESARSQIETEVASLHHQLQLNGEVPLGRLGVLHRGENPQFPLFEPSADSLPARRYDGLRPVDVTPLQAEDVGSVERQDPIHRTMYIPAPLKIVASVIVIMVALGIIYSTTSLVNGHRMNYASLDTGLSSEIVPAASIEPTSYADIVSREIVLNIAMPDEEEAETCAAEPSVRNDLSSGQQASSPQLSLSRYIMVVASLPSMASAERHIRNIGDNSLRIIEMDGKFRVYAASASDIDSARSLADSLSARYPNVWICRR